MTCTQCGGVIHFGREKFWSTKHGLHHDICPTALAIDQATRLQEIIQEHWRELNAKKPNRVKLKALWDEARALKRLKRGRSETCNRNCGCAAYYQQTFP